MEVKLQNNKDVFEISGFSGSGLKLLSKSSINAKAPLE